MASAFGDASDSGRARISLTLACADTVDQSLALRLKTRIGEHREKECIVHHARDANPFVSGGEKQHHSDHSPQGKPNADDNSKDPKDIFVWAANNSRTDVSLAGCRRDVLPAEHSHDRFFMGGSGRLAALSILRCDAYPIRAHPAVVSCPYP